MNEPIVYFVKLTTDERNHRAKWLVAHPLALSILYMAAMRARKSDNEDLELRRGEFVLSETETKIFGLKKSQHGQIYRQLCEMEKHGFIEKTGNKTGNANCHIYRFIESDAINWTNTNRERNRERIGNAQGETKKDKKDRYINIINNIYVLYGQKINKNSRLTASAKNKISTRLKTYSEQELSTAIENFSANTWWMDHNSHRGIAWFFNSDDRIEQFINLKPETSKFNLAII